VKRSSLGVEQKSLIYTSILIISPIQGIEDKVLCTRWTIMNQIA